jgi:ring-1,2-phenylacetyl-CoA epoxidase subunit PaaD
VTEYGTHVSIARARAGLGDAATPAGDGADVATVAAILATVPDPELPIISIVELGMVHRTEVTPSAIRVTILPTFVGCPAVDLIRATVGEALAPLGRTVIVDTSYDPPWTSERISAAGREALARAGIAPPADPADVRCPWCASPRVVMDSAFGPTQCRSLFYCRACRQPFEAMKRV